MFFGFCLFLGGFLFHCFRGRFFCHFWYLFKLVACSFVFFALVLWFWPFGQKQKMFVSSVGMDYFCWFGLFTCVSFACFLLCSTVLVVFFQRFVRPKVIEKGVRWFCNIAKGHSKDLIMSFWRVA